MTATASSAVAKPACHATPTVTRTSISISLSVGCTSTYELTVWGTVAEGNNKGEWMISRITTPPWSAELPSCSYQWDFRDTTSHRLLAGLQGGITCIDTSTTIPTSTTLPEKPPVSPTITPTITPTSPATSSTPSTIPVQAISTPTTPIPQAPEARIVPNCGCATG